MSSCPTEVNFIIKVSQLLQAEHWLSEHAKVCSYAKKETTNFYYCFNVNSTTSGLRVKLLCKCGQELDLGGYNKK